MTIKIVNRRQILKGEYIGRPSPLGNPFPINTINNRETVLNKYSEWFATQLSQTKPNNKFFKELLRLHTIHKETGELTLVCWCAPLACHGDIIKNYLLHLETTS